MPGGKGRGTNKLHFSFKFSIYNKSMKKLASISALFFSLALLMPYTAPAEAVNAPAAKPAETIRKGPRAEKARLIRPDRKPPRLPARNGVTPYGDFCTKCSKYGMGKRRVEHREAVLAMKAYFMHKGFSVHGIKGRGRFLKAEIYKGDKLVDRVVFDRRTGRIRSIY